MFIIANDDDPDLQHLLGLDVKAQHRSSASFILKMKETHRLSQAAIDDIVEGCQGLFSLTIQRVKCSIKAKLADAGIDPADVPNLDCVFSDITDPFDGLETYYKQESYFRKEFGFIVSQSALTYHIYVPVLIKYCRACEIKLQINLSIFL